MVEQNARQSLAIADRGYVLENGRIVAASSAAHLKGAPAVQQAYLGAARPDDGGAGDDDSSAGHGDVALAGGGREAASPSACRPPLQSPQPGSAATAAAGPVPRHLQPTGSRGLTPCSRSAF